MAFNFGKSIIRKCSDGYYVRAAADFGNSQRVIVSTYKRNGLLVSTMRVVELNDVFEVFGMYQDFSRTLIQEKVRGTMKAVVAQQTRALAMAQELFSEVQAQYPE